MAKKPVKPIKKASKPSPKPVTKVVAKKKVEAKKSITKAIIKKATKKKEIKKVVAKKVELKKNIAPKAKKKPIAPKSVKKTLLNKKPLKKVSSKVVSKANKITAEKPEQKKLGTIPTKAAIQIKHEKPMILPKLKTKTSVPYQPKYSNSILNAKEVNYKNQVKYSDNDLKMFKQIIQHKIEASKSELSYLQGILSKKDGSGYHDSDGKNFSIEEGGIGLEKEQLTQMARRQMQFIDHLEKALIRIENKTYGICIVTGKLIDKDRLKAVPHAKLSLEAKMASNGH